MPCLTHKPCKSMFTHIVFLLFSQEIINFWEKKSIISNPNAISGKFLYLKILVLRENVNILEKLFASNNFNCILINKLFWLLWYKFNFILKIVIIGQNDIHLYTLKGILHEAHGGKKHSQEKLKRNRENAKLEVLICPEQPYENGDIKTVASPLNQCLFFVG